MLLRVNLQFEFLIWSSFEVLSRSELELDQSEDDENPGRRWKLKQLFIVSLRFTPRNKLIFSILGPF